MNTTYKPYTIDELCTEIYEDNYSHIEFMENMNGGDCDCNIHTTMATILKYWGGIMHNHIWECSDIPGLYNCTCGSGYWNSKTKEIVKDVD